MSVRSLWVLAIATIAVLLTMFGLMRADMLERFGELQAQLDRRFADVTKNQEKLMDRQDDVRYRLGALESETRKHNQQGEGSK